MLNFIFPERNICFLCEDYGKDIKGNLCSICKSKLVFIDECNCSICGRKIERECDLDELHQFDETSDSLVLEESLETRIMKCRECIKHPHFFTKSVSPLSYEADIKRAIYDFKYNDKSHLYKLFGKLMVKSIVDNDLEYVDMIVPIPLYKDREKRRGFNQANLLAKYISKDLGIELVQKNLIRVENTKALNQLDRTERIKSITGVFDIKDKSIFMQKKILLVDDILTTGTTVDECSKLLLDNGAGEIFVATLAVTPNKPKIEEV